MLFSYAETTEMATAEATRALEASGADPTDFVDAIDRFARACADAALIRHRWDRKGRPVIGTGSTGQKVEHALFKALREAEEVAAKMGERLMLTPATRAGRRLGGRPQGMSPAADRPTIRRAA
jgi:3-hydroxyisobutyrate dehydrogenase-like beta-hydroxyacid dehydrogenase